MIMKIMGFREKDEMILGGEGSYSVGQRLNNEAYKFEDLEDIERSGTCSVIGLKFYHN